MEEHIVSTHTWDDLDISSELLRGIYSMGFESPSAIQQVAIKPLIDGRDVLAQAQSGTGKTATFSIGALQKVNLAIATTQVLILSPTRELSQQTANVIERLGEYMTGLTVEIMVGGRSGDVSRSSGDVSRNSREKANIFSKRSIPHIVCGCPGRVEEMLRTGRLSPKGIRLIILDEADELLSVGFKDQIAAIVRQMAEDTQLAFFSATVPSSMRELAYKILNNPVNISVKREQLTLEGIAQYYIAVDSDPDKYSVLEQLFSYISMSQCIIYCNTVKRVQSLYEKMQEDEYPVCFISSNMEKGERDLAFNDFKSGKFRVLISTDITARGIDIQQVSTVINFDVPKSVDTYLHRIGRSGRWGRKGVGINLVSYQERGLKQAIETHYATEIKEMPENIASILG